MKYDECKEDFPDDLVRELCQLVIRAGERRVCGVRALALIRTVHGLPKYAFTGTEARRIYERTKAIKDKHMREAKR